MSEQRQMRFATLTLNRPDVDLHLGILTNSENNQLIFETLTK